MGLEITKLEVGIFGIASTFITFIWLFQPKWTRCPLTNVLDSTFLLGQITNSHLQNFGKLINGGDWNKSGQEENLKN